MTSEEITNLQQARENLARRRNALAKPITAVDLPSVESAAELATVQAAIDPIDTALGWRRLEPTCEALLALRARRQRLTR